MSVRYNDDFKREVVRAKLTQDIDFLEILSLKIKQEDTYKINMDQMKAQSQLNIDAMRETQKQDHQ